MAHNEPYILNVLLEKLRPIPGDIFIHIDRKVCGFMLNEMLNIVNALGGYYLNVLMSVGAIFRRLNVNWHCLSKL